MKYDYIVIGGGIIGMTTAREIANRGASVAILDRQTFGNGLIFTSSNSKSEISPVSTLK